MNEAILNREKGASPLTISTSLALESLCGYGEFESNKPFVLQTEQLWVNVRTLFRNVFSSLDAYTKKTANIEDLLNAVIEDISVMNSVLEYQTADRLKARFYICTYKGLHSEFPKAEIKEPKTDLQKFEKGMEDDFIKAFLNSSFSQELDLKIFNVKLEGSGGTVLFLTHLPIDLLWRSGFRKPYLLESHTGSIKGKMKWYTKLTGGSKNVRIPFNRMTIQVFGDGNNLFSAMSRKIKTPVLNLAEERQWSPVTTTEKIRADLKRMTDVPLANFLKELL